MTVGGGEAADQMVRMMLSGTEVAVRLSGSALKNLLALTMALASNRKTLSGKVNMGKMLRETRDLRRFPMTPLQYKQFKKLAKKHKLLFSVIKDKDGRGKVLDVILPVTELDRANAIFERILYTLPPKPERKPAKPLQKGHEVFQPERQAQERQAPEQAQVRRRERPPQEWPREKQRQTPERKKPILQPQEAPVRPPQPQREVSQRSADQGHQQAPVAQRQGDKGKNGSRSERDSPVIKISSSIPKENGAMKGTSERPSVAARLEGYRAQGRKQSAPAKTISKVKTKAKPQAKAR